VIVEIDRLVCLLFLGEKKRAYGAGHEATPHHCSKNWEPNHVGKWFPPWSRVNADSLDDIDAAAGFMIGLTTIVENIHATD